MIAQKILTGWKLTGKICIATAFPAFLFSSCSHVQKKPNILWITIEDTSPQFVGCYGNENARTPVIDQLAEEGVRFTNAFSTGTVCSPSRTAIITGVKTYRTGTGNHRSKYPVPDYMKGFPYYLQQAGYFTSNNKKTDYNVAHDRKYIQEAWNESSGTAGWWHRKPGQPFFAVFNFMDSHQSRTMTNPYTWYRKNVLEKLTPKERIGDEDFDMPPFYADTPEMRKQFARVYNSLKLTDNEIGELLNRLDKDHLRDSTIIFFYADHGEGEPRGKTNGINLGYRVPFVIWFPEMYKDLSPWGTRVVTDELVDFEDLAPTLISLAGGTVPDYMKGRILMGKNRSEPVDHLNLSNDRSDNGIDMVRSVTDGRYLYSRNYLPFMPELRYIRYMEIGEIKQQMRMDLADGTLNSLQKKIFEKRPAEFLFDIENDIWETRNLVGDPEAEPVLQKMRKRLDEEVMRSRDVMFLPEYEIAEISKKTTPFEYRMNEKDYPLQEIYRAASLSGKRDEKTAAEQVHLLQNGNKIIRYWAAVGLRSQEPSILKKYKSALRKAIDDPYPPVNITLSAINYEVFNDPLAEENLKTWCTNENDLLALMTTNYLIYSNNKEPFVDVVKKSHNMKGRTYNVKAACMDFLGSMGKVPNNSDYSE